MFKKLFSLLPAGIDAVMILSPENRRYFTGFESSDGVLLVTENSALFLTDSRYIEAACEQITCCVCEELTSFSQQVTDFLKKNNCRRVGIEGDWLSVNALKSYRKKLPDFTLTASCVNEKINLMRSVKTGEETAKIKAAQAIAEKAFDHIIGFIRPGVTEKDIALELDYFMQKNGSRSVAFETIALSGASTSKPHGVPSDKKVCGGDFVTMDYGAVVDGYRSDMTRTVAVGSATDGMVKVYNTVLEAQLAVCSSLKAGMACAEGDKIARDIIDNAGYGKYFRHSTGHSVGLEIHEKPNLSPKSADTLQPGNIVTVEPGIYIPGKFGVRIEDMVLIATDGCENLTKITKELIII